MRLARVFAAALGTVLVACVAAEIVLRARAFDPVGDLRRAGPVVIRASRQPGLKYELTPGAHAVAWGSDVRVNSAGFREREFAREKTPGSRRIVVLGDSVTFGTALAAGETYPKRIEALLAPQHAEVLNLAVPGYDILDEVAVLENVGLELDPGLVVVGYCINDVGVHSLNLEYIEGIERFDSPLYHLRIAQWLARETQRRELGDWMERVNRDDNFSRRFAGKIALIAGDEELEAMRRQLAEYCDTHAAELTTHPFLGWYASTPKLGRLRFALERFAALARERQFALEIVFLPYLKSDEHPAAYANVRAIVAHECERTGLDFFDPLPLFGGDLREFRQTPQDGLHLNAAGHERLASALVPLLSR